MNTYHVYTVCMNPTLNRSSALQRVKLSDALEIRDGIMIFTLDSHMLCSLQLYETISWYKGQTGMPDNQLNSDSVMISSVYFEHFLSFNFFFFLCFFLLLLITPSLTAPRPHS